MERNYEQKYIELGLNIMYYRKLKGITQEKLAQLTGYSRNHIQQIETAQETPSLYAVYIISDALEVDTAKLFETR